MAQRTCVSTDCDAIIPSDVTASRRYCSMTCFYREQHRRRFRQTHGPERKEHVALGRRGTALERFEVKVDRQPGGCWLWTGATTDKGYGVFWDGKLGRAHRWAYTHWRGPIPEGLTLDHLCQVKACVNPDHLEPVTALENYRRARG